MHDQDWEERFAGKVFKEEVHEFCQMCDTVVVSHGEAGHRDLFSVREGFAYSFTVIPNGRFPLEVEGSID